MSECRCNYKVSLGLIDMLSALTNKSKQEVWAHLSDETAVCLDRMRKKDKNHAYRWTIYPGTQTRLKIKVNKQHTYNHTLHAWEYTNLHDCTIEMDAKQTEDFTSDQVEDFLVGILLGEEKETTQNT